jgi:hypothetical protein
LLNFLAHAKVFLHVLGRLGNGKIRRSRKDST